MHGGFHSNKLVIFPFAKLGLFTYNNIMFYIPCMNDIFWHKINGIEILTLMMNHCNQVAQTFYFEVKNNTKYMIGGISFSQYATFKNCLVHIVIPS